MTPTLTGLGTDMGIISQRPRPRGSPRWLQRQQDPAMMTRVRRNGFICPEGAGLCHAVNVPFLPRFRGRFWTCRRATGVKVGRLAAASIPSGRLGLVAVGALSGFRVRGRDQSDQAAIHCQAGPGTSDHALPASRPAHEAVRGAVARVPDLVVAHRVVDPGEQLAGHGNLGCVLSLAATAADDVFCSGAAADCRACTGFLNRRPAHDQ